MVELSFVIPAHQEAAQISRTLKAIKNISWPIKIETLVIDDASTDGTGEIAKTWGARVLQVQYRNRSAARNYGAKNALGNWIVFLDADVEIQAGWERDIGRLINGNWKYVSQGPIIPSSRSNSLLQSFRENFAAKKTSGRFCSFLSHGGLPQLNSACFLISQKQFKAIGGFDEELGRCEDSDLGYRLFMDGAVFSICSSLQSKVYWNQGTWAYLKRFFAQGLWTRKLEQKWQTDLTGDGSIFTSYADFPPLQLIIFYTIQVLQWAGWQWQKVKGGPLILSSKMQFKLEHRNYLLPFSWGWRSKLRPGPFTRFVLTESETRIYVFSDVKKKSFSCFTGTIENLEEHFGKQGIPKGFELIF